MNLICFWDTLEIPNYFQFKKTVLTMKTEIEMSFKAKAKFFAFYISIRVIFGVLLGIVLFKVLDNMEFENETWDKIENSYFGTQIIIDGQHLLVLAITVAPEVAARIYFTIRYLGPYVWKFLVIVTFVIKHLLTTGCTCQVKIFVAKMREIALLPNELKSFRNRRKKYNRKHVPNGRRN